MSSKSRKTEQLPTGFVEPDKREYYFTPAAATRAILPHVRHPNPRTIPSRVWDIGSGKGELASVVKAFFPHHGLVGCEIDESRREMSRWVVKWDHLYANDFTHEVGFRERVEADELGIPAFVITNPPFTKWHQWIEQCIDLSDGASEVVAFARTGVLEGKRGGERARLWTANKWDLFPLTWRPSCNGAGRDSASYMWVIFGSTRTGAVMRLDRLPQDEP